MNPSAKPSPLPGAEALRLYAPISADLAEVEKILKTELRSDYPAVDELVRYGRMLGGKRLRPALLLLAGKATGGVGRSHLVLAAVLEMIHTATLIHDDVLDQAEMRRHLATVNSRWDNEASVLLGDFLFTHAFYLASTMESTFACRMIGQATNTVCEGELRQKSRRGDFDLSEDDYLEIIGAKTAALCAVCCQLGAYCSNADDETVARLTEYGRCLGVAFQIVDDLLDWLGDESDTGKTLGTDLDQQIATLPLIRLHSLLDAPTREALFGAVQNGAPGAVEALRGALADHGAFEYAQVMAKGYASRAQQQLTDLPGSDARDLLAVITEYVVSRTN